MGLILSALPDGPCLIADDYAEGALEALTLDRRMASLPGSRLL